MIDGPRRHWADWGRSDWNAALLDHFFVSREENVRPVARLAVTPSELAEVVGDADADAERVREAFLNVVRCPADEFRRFLSRRTLDEWDGDEEPPPFFVFLIFTCFVASGFDEDVVDEGNFRERICTLLNHSTHSALPDLAMLWRRFRTWLDRRIAEGHPYRPLMLPDPGHMVRIGHSVRLAFPRRRDLVRLAEEIGHYDSPEDLPVYEVLHTIRGKRKRFSQELRRELEDFRTKVVKGHVSSLYDHPFWTASRAAVAFSTGEKEERPHVEYRLVLVVENRPSRLVLLASSLPEDRRNAFEGEIVEVDVPGYPYVVASIRDTPADLAVSLLRGAPPEGLPDLRRSFLWTCVQQGVLLFERDEAGFWKLSPSLPALEVEVRAIVREDLSSSFRRRYGEIDRDAFHDSRYQGWCEVDRFRGGQLWSFGSNVPLEDIRCLRRTLTPPQIRLTGSVALDDGYLGIPPLLPEITIPEADEVRMYRIGESSGGSPTELVPRGDTFAIPFDEDTSLEGEYNVVARRSSGHVVAQRRVIFRSRGLQQKYKKPTQPKTWIVEGSRVDRRRLSDEAFSTDPATRSESREARVTFPMLKLGSARSEEGSPSREVAPSKESETSRFVECCSALASNRKGIPIQDFLRLIEEVLDLRDDYRSKWDVARSWIESGCFDRMDDTRWRRTAYFAVPPHLAVHEHPDGCRAVLVGLAPVSVRRRLRRWTRKHGLREEERRTFSPWSPPVLSWTARSEKAFETLCEECELPPPEALFSLEDRIASIEEVASRVGRGATHYEFQKSWSWKRETFCSSDRASESGVEIERLRRHDSPDTYRVSVDGVEVCCTRSRNWSLLVAYALRGELPFEKRGHGDLVRHVRGQVYLPLPVARYVAVVGRSVPGPRRVAGEWTYGYDCSGQRLRDRLVSALWNMPDHDSLAGRLQWIAALARRFRNTRGASYVPSEGLTAKVSDSYLHGILGELAASPVPSRVLPYLRELERDVGSQDTSER